MRDPNISAFISGPAIAELLEQIARASHARGFTGGLNPAQWSALRYFSRANESACTVTGFAKHHASSHGTASQTISALVRNGYLERKAVPNNRRTHRLIVTSDGWDMLKTDPIGLVTECIEDLSGHQKGVLAEALETVLRNMLQKQSEEG
ncbi:MAG: MarR family transcriptional regulator [Alphaproteobacteria bacterium]